MTGPMLQARALHPFEAEPFSLVVDLSQEEIGRRWFRGAGTLAALCGTAMMLAPGIEPFVPAAAASAPVLMHNVQLSALSAPSLAGEGEARTMPVARGLQAGERGGVKRVSGDVSDGLYWSLRSAGASPQLAADYLKALATRIDVGEVAPYDRFEFVVAEGSGALVFAGLDRAHASDVELMQWTVGGRRGWFDTNTSPHTASGLMAPVAGRVTSHFGMRGHPILGFARMHSGIDFGSRYGSPIVAAADGQVVGAGWAGGYGRQVIVAHGSAMVTTYSHMSAIAAAPGTPVRQGQVIGYVGSSGLSTGPHLHFEVRVGGRPVNPLTARLVMRSPLEGAQLAAFKARVKQLRSIPTTAQKPVPAAA